MTLKLVHHLKLEPQPNSIWPEHRHHLYMAALRSNQAATEKPTANLLVLHLSYVSHATTVHLQDPLAKPREEVGDVDQSQVAK